MGLKRFEGETDDELRIRQNAYDRAWRHANKDKVAAYSKRSYDKHADVCRARGREGNRKRRVEQPGYDAEVARRYRAAHPDRVEASGKAYRESHKESVAARNKAWRLANPDKCAAAYELRLALNPNVHAEQYARDPKGMQTRAAKWRKNNPDAAREINRKNDHTRRAKKKACNEHYTLKELRALRRFTNNRCIYCGFVGKLTVDHVAPLAKGGSNGIYNIQLICKSCNSSKQDRDPIVFARTMGFAL